MPLRYAQPPLFRFLLLKVAKNLCSAALRQSSLWSFRLRYAPPSLPPFGSARVSYCRAFAGNCPECVGQATSPNTTAVSLLLQRLQESAVPSPCGRVACALSAKASICDALLFPWSSASASSFCASPFCFAKHQKKSRVEKNKCFAFALDFFLCFAL